LFGAAKAISIATDFITKLIKKLVIAQIFLTLIYLLSFLPQSMVAGRAVGTWATEGKENPPLNKW
jgi:hypothetical protein